MGKKKAISLKILIIKFNSILTKIKSSKKCYYIITYIFMLIFMPRGDQSYLTIRSIVMNIKRDFYLDEYIIFNRI